MVTTPQGGSSDFLDDFDSLDEIQERLDKNWYCNDWYEILDMQEREWVDVRKKKIVK